MLSYLCDDNGITFCLTIDFFNDGRAAQAFLVVAQRIFRFQLLYIFQPLFMLFLLHHIDQAFQHFFGITYYAAVNQHVFIDFRCIHINLDYLCISCKISGIAGHTVAESGAYCDQQVTFCHSQIGSLGSVHTQHTGIQFIFSGERAFSHKGIRYRCLDLMCQSAQFLPCISCNGSASHKDERTLCLPDHLCRLSQICLFNLTYGGFHRLWHCIFKVCLGCSHILCDIHKDRTGPAALCNDKGTADGFCKLLHIFYDKAVFCDRHNNTGYIYLLEAVFSQKGNADITGNGNHRNRVHMGCGNTCHQISGARAAGRKAYTHFSCRTGIAVRCVGCALLMGSQYVMDLITVFI